jgi:hypothetical protein
MRNVIHFRTLASLVILQLGAVCGFAQTRLASKADYHKYIDPLVEVKDFGTHYSEDGAADASVLFPDERSSTFHYDRPSDEVISIVRLGAKGVPLLIDCLTDGRLTTMQFDGNNITKAMSEPVGYVCLDILMASTWGGPISDPQCEADGLGACMNYGFYFRPDDYYDCFETTQTCRPRPWVAVVQRNWRRQFVQNRLRYRNPYETVSDMPEYKEFATPETLLSGANQETRIPALARSDSPWNVLAYGGKGDMKGAPICHPLSYFSDFPKSLDFDGDFFDDKPADLATNAKATYLGEIGGRKIYEVIQTVRRRDATQTNLPPTMKILLVERQSGEFCDIYENEYAYDPTNETDEAVILNIKGRKVLKTYESDERTWFLVYWTMNEKGPVLLNADGLYKAIQSASPAGAQPYGGRYGAPINLTNSHFTADMFRPDDSLLGTVDLELAVEGSEIVALRKTWVPAHATSNPQ